MLGVAGIFRRSVFGICRRGMRHDSRRHLASALAAAVYDDLFAAGFMLNIPGWKAANSPECSEQFTLAAPNRSLWRGIVIHGPDPSG